MSKLAPNSTKYVVKAKITANGVVEKPDVIGAIFGQTEGVMGADLNLRELQRTGKIGRVEVKIKSENGKSEGTIIIPSSLTSSETALIAATLETIDRIGPCTAVVKLESVEDVMEDKRKQIIEKAKGILKNMIEVNAPDTEEISEQIKESVRSEEITSFEGLPAGPGLRESDSVIIVEGRADVITLLKFGIRNTIGIEGTSVPKPVADLCKEKECTVLTDGDRGGLLIVKELMQVTDVDFVARAPEGKEVEELSKKEVFKSLRDKVSSQQFRNELSFIEKGLPEKASKSSKGIATGTSVESPTSTVTGAFKPRPPPEYPTRTFKPSVGVQRGRRLSDDRRYEPRAPVRTPRLRPDERKLYQKTLEELIGTRAACIFGNNGELLGRVPSKELANTIRTLENVHTVVFDGKVDSEIEYTARRKGVRLLICMEKDPTLRSSMTILSKEDLN
ncbi:MAG TPA: DNA primase DnaG [archaeon]|nr:DNA primase DnaG [archaeon]